MQNAVGSLFCRSLAVIRSGIVRSRAAELALLDFRLRSTDRSFSARAGFRSRRQVEFCRPRSDKLAEKLSGHRHDRRSSTWAEPSTRQKKLETCRSENLKKNTLAETRPTFGWCHFPKVPWLLRLEAKLMPSPVHTHPLIQVSLRSRAKAISKFAAHEKNCTLRAKIAMNQRILRASTTEILGVGWEVSTIDSQDSRPLSAAHCPPSTQRV